MHWVEAFIAHYGLLAVALGSVFEGETVVTLGGFSAHQGLLPPTGVALMAMVGAFAGDQVIFWLTRANRDRALVRRVEASRAGQVAIGTVARHPTAFTLGFRFMFGLRTVGPVAIALAGVPPLRFALLNALSAVVWGVVWTTLGYLAGGAVERVLGEVSRLEHRALIWLAVGLGVAIGGWLIRHHLLRRTP